MKMKAFIFII